MRIAQVAPLYESVPPRLYGGTERVVAHLTNELVRRGHDVTLFASGDSETLGRLVPCRDRALRLDPELTWDMPCIYAQMARVLRSASEFDLIHFHTELWHLPFFGAHASRTVTTLHGRLDIRDVAVACAEYPDYPFVSISNSQRTPLPMCMWAGTVYHGYPTDLYEFSPKPRSGYLAFLGRIAPEKGPHRAIEIARLAGQPLVIAAKVDAADRVFHAETVEPLLDDPLISFIGEIGEDEKSRFLGNARALLVPITWPEPFGLVMIEAMACGTPVIAFNHGSVPELIEHGVTGFIVANEKEAAEALRHIDELDRRKIRARFEARFSVEAMADGYLAVYQRIVGASRSPMLLPKSGKREAVMAARVATASPQALGIAAAESKAIN
jgi:glycosyltransferase involved in cell wall biosynthesis